MGHGGHGGHGHLRSTYASIDGLGGSRVGPISADRRGALTALCQQPTPHDGSKQHPDMHSFLSSVPINHVAASGYVEGMYSAPCCDGVDVCRHHRPHGHHKRARRHAQRQCGGKGSHGRHGVDDCRRQRVHGRRERTHSARSDLLLPTSPLGGTRDISLATLHENSGPFDESVDFLQNVMDDTDYIKVQPKRFAPRANRETADGRFWRNLRFLEFERQYVCPPSPV